MSFAPRRLAIAVCAFTAPAILAAAMSASAAAPGPYLTWQNKAPQAAPAPAPAVVSGGEAYPVPPSPYGQVGDPFVKARGGRALSWPSKQEPPRAESKFLANIDVPPPPAAELPKGPVSLSTPVPVAKPAPVHVPDEAVAAPAPKPAPQAMRPIPNPTPDAPKVGAPKAVASPKTGTAKPAAAPPPAPVQAAPQPMASDGSYQVPATSKYAARIAQARASETRDEAPPPQQQQAPAKPATKAKAGHTATAPAPAEPLAAQETDHVFIPGEQYKNPEDGPRLYSLHRAYGLTPDPITVDRDASGAILDGADLNADEGPKKLDSQDSHPSSDKADTKASQ